MSTIRVDNFGPSAGGTTYSARGIAKAWVNFNGIGTIAVRDSENVSSVTDNGTGDYTTNFSSSFDVADYVFSGGIHHSTGTAASVLFINNSIATPLTTSSFRSKVGESGPSYYDPLIYAVTFHGDLA